MSTETPQQTLDAEMEQQTTEVDHSPTKLSSYAAIGAALVAALTSAPFALLALPLGFGGVAIIAAGLVSTESRSYVTFGTAGLFLSVLIAGGFGTPAEFLLASTIATVLAWDLGQNAISLGEQIGRHSETSRNEIVHGAASAIVASLAAVIGYAVFMVAGGGRPVAGLGMLVAAIVFFAWAMRT